MKKLALLISVVLLSTLAAAQTTGNPQLGGHWPSLTSYASLNQVAPPADYTFEVNHLDAAHGVDHSVGVLSLNPNFYYIKYELLETQITTDPDVSNLITFCGANAENAFYHYNDDTTVDLSACTGGSAGTVIKGWPGGTATSRDQARVISCPASGTPIRYVWNHGDTTCLQPYMKHRTELDVTTPVTGTAHMRGAFWDEIEDMSGCTPSSTCMFALAPTPSVGGHITELSNENRATLASDGKYETNFKALETAIQSDIQSFTTGDGQTYPNLANLNDTSAQNIALASGGVLTEFFDSEAVNLSTNLGTQYLWQYMGPILAANKIGIWTEGDSNTPTDPTFVACDYTSADSRHRMWAMTNYWQIKDVGQKYAWYSQKPQFIDLSTFWYAAQQRDIGQPTGAQASIQTGTTPGGYTFNIFERDFTKGKVFTVTRNGYGADTTLSYSSRVGTPISLGGTYHVLNYDNTLGPPITTLQPCYLEAVTVVPDTSTTISISPASATIPLLGTQQFSVSPGGTSGTWSASAGTIGATNGVFTAPAGAGTAQITFTPTSGSPANATVIYQALTVTPSSAALNVGATQQFTSNFPATWSATGGTISGSGLYTAPSTNGTFTITATAVNGGSTATATVTVTGQQTLIPFSLSPTLWTQQTTINTTITKTFTATNPGTGSVTPTVTLTGSGKFSLSANTCTAPVAGGGNCSITAQFVSTTVGAFAATINLTDTAGGNQNIPLNVSIPTGTVVTISPTTATMPISGTGQFTATTSNGSGVTWTTTCTGATINSSGFFNAPATPQVCTVTATAADGSGSNASCSVTIVTVAVNPSAVTLRILSTQQFTANVSATWSATCGTITSSGIYTAPGAPTSCSVVATATNGGTTGTSTATIVNPPPGTTGGKQRGGRGRWKLFH